jgi:diamine N-acetyltransferase
MQHDFNGGKPSQFLYLRYSLFIYSLPGASAVPKRLTQALLSVGIEENMKIRKAIADDASRIAWLNKEVQTIHVQIDSTKFKEFDHAAVSSWIHGLFANENAIILVCELEECIVGYLIAIIYERKENPFKHADRYIEIDQISIQQDYRNKGIGRALLNEIKGIAKEKGIARLDLSTWTKNGNAISSFQKMGFKECWKRMELHI